MKKKTVATIAIVGGDGRYEYDHGGVMIRTFASTKYGAGNLRSLRGALRGKTIDLVVLLTRWLSHSEFHVIVSECRALGVGWRLVGGGMTSACREVERFIDNE